MDIQYRHNAKNNYVVLKEDSTFLKDYKLNMILKNDIPGILKVYESCVDGQTELSYIISSRESIKDLYEKKKMSFDELLNILKAMINVCYTVQSYLLKAEDILLDPELIFYDYCSRDISFCYYPNTNRDLKYEMRNFIEKIMLITEHKDRKGVEFIYGVFNICNKREFLISDIDDYIKDFEKVNINDCFTRRDTNSEYIDNQYLSYKDSDSKYNELRDYKFRYDDFSEKEDDFSENVVCENSDNITYLKESKRMQSRYTFLPNRLAEDCRYEALSGLRSGSDNQYNDDVYAQDMKSIVKNNVIIKKITEVFSSKDRKIASNNKNVKKSKEECKTEDKSKIKDESKLKSHIDLKDGGKSKNSYPYSKKYNYEDRCEDFNDDTVYINDSIHNSIRTLYSLSEQENIVINTNPFIIGKLSSRVDFVIENNTISRIHLKIVNENGEYYIEDMNSKNGTYLNGIQAEPHEKIKVDIGDKIRIAGYEYVFR